MHVVVKWDPLGNIRHDEGWDYDRCLYAYLGPGNEILYIGLCWNSTVDERFCGKRAMWRYLGEQGIRRCTVVLGEVAVSSGRMTRQILSDVESLLIFTEQPPANISCTKSRISRPGMVVSCSGYWPGGQNTYYDDYGVKTTAT